MSISQAVHTIIWSTQKYKVDLDIGGRKNSYETIEIGIENITERWFANRRRVQKVLKRSLKKTESEAAYKFNFDQPKYLNFFNDAEKNRMGVKKGYRIQLGSMLKQLYPEDWMITPMMSWSLYQMAVTKYKENETQSSSIYNQNAPTNPQVRFKMFKNRTPKSLEMSKSFSHVTVIHWAFSHTPFWTSLNLMWSVVCDTIVGNEMANKEISIQLFQRDLFNCLLVDGTS